MAGISSASIATSGLPVFCDSSAAYPAASASMPSAMRKSSAARSLGGVAAQRGNARSAAATACSGLASVTAAIFAPVAGSRISSRGPWPATSRPPINNSVCMIASTVYAAAPPPPRGPQRERLRPPLLCFIITYIISKRASRHMNSDVIITCAVTGDDTKVTRNPHCPITPAQIADSALEAARTGAAIVHIHVRDPETGTFSMATRHYREVVKRIRESGVDVIVNLTCGMGGYICVGEHGLQDTPAPGTDFVSQEERMRHVIELCQEGLYRPDIATLDCGSLNFGDGNRAYVSTP